MVDHMITPNEQIQFICIFRLMLAVGMNALVYDG